MKITCIIELDTIPILDLDTHFKYPCNFTLYNNYIDTQSRKLKARMVTRSLSVNIFEQNYENAYNTFNEIRKTSLSMRATLIQLQQKRTVRY